LRHGKAPGDKPLVDGRNVTGFTDGEEEDVGLTKVVPFLVEDELMRLGAIFSKVKNWGVHTVKDGQLITGQNPASSGPAAKLLLETLTRRRNSQGYRGGRQAAGIHAVISQCPTALSLTSFSECLQWHCMTGPDA